MDPHTVPELESSGINLKTPQLKCKTCKKLFQTTLELEKHRVLSCQINVGPPENWSHFKQWENNEKKNPTIHAYYTGSDMNSKEYFDWMLDSTDDSSESSIDSEIASTFDKMVDDAISTGSDEEEIARVKMWVETNEKRKDPPEWYHMPKLSIETIPKKLPKIEERFACIQCQRTFPNNLLLKRHSYFHNQQNTYHCVNCNLGFKYKHNLTKHESQKCIDRFKTIQPTYTIDYTQTQKNEAVPIQQDMTLMIPQNVVTQQPTDKLFLENFDTDLFLSSDSD